LLEEKCNDKEKELLQRMLLRACLPELLALLIIKTKKPLKRDGISSTRLAKNQDATDDGDTIALSNLLDSETVPGQQYLLETLDGVFPLVHKTRAAAIPKGKGVSRKGVSRKGLAAHRDLSSGDSRRSFLGDACRLQKTKTGSSGSEHQDRRV
jgi:hypothetical protein